MPTWIRFALALAVGAGVTATVPATVHDRFGGRLWAGDAEAQHVLARGVSTRQADGVAAAHFATGAARFDGEWAFGSALMAAIGYAQVAEQHPAETDALIVELERALDALLSPAARRYDTAAWREDALDGLGGPHAHLAYLGYVAVPLGMHRTLVPNSRFADTHDAIAAHLRQHLGEVDTGLVETYPGERYPVDNAVALAGLAWHSRATGRDDAALLAGWARDFPRFLDADSGLLVQSVDASGRPVDAPRGSGTFFAAWFLAPVIPDLSRELWRGARAAQYRETLGFGTMREYPAGVFGLGDIDSGPVIFGQGVSATGFAIGVARAHGDERAYRRLLATASLVGAPNDGPLGWRWLAGGPLGDAILFAMLTTPAVM